MSLPDHEFVSSTLPSTTVENDENVVDVLDQDDDVHVIKGKINFFEKSQLAYGDLSHASLYCGVFNQKIVAVEKVKKGFISPTVYGFHLLHINHSNVIKVLHSAEQDSSFSYFALEFCLGSLDQLFLEEDNPRKYLGPMPPEKEVLFQLASGLDFLSSRKIVHRNIKPENVVIASSGRQDSSIVLKWTGFGSAYFEKRQPSHKISSKPAEAFKTDVIAAGRVFYFYLTNGFYPPENLLKSPEQSRLSSSHYAHDVIVNVMLATEPKTKSGWQSELLKSLKTSEDFMLLVLCSKRNLDDESISILSQLVTAVGNKTDINCFDLQKRTPLILLSTCNTGESFMPAFEILMKRRDIDLVKTRKALNLVCSKHNSRQHQFAAIQRLVERGFDVKDNIKARSSLCASFTDGRAMLPILRFLIQHGLDVHATTEDGANGLTEVCGKEDSSYQNLLDVVHFLIIEQKMNVHHTDKYGDNALHSLMSSFPPFNLDIKEEDINSVVRFLISSGLDVNKTNNGGLTPLSLLSYKSEKLESVVNMARLLIQEGADVNATTDCGQNALLILCDAENMNAPEDPHFVDFVRLLAVETKSDVNHSDNQGRNALHLLCQRDDHGATMDIEGAKRIVEAARLLVTNTPINVNAKTKDGGNALHLLLFGYNEPSTFVDIFTFFVVESGIDLNASNAKGKNVLHLLCGWSGAQISQALFNLMPGMVDLLVRNGCDLNAKNSTGSNALHTFCKHLMDFLDLDEEGEECYNDEMKGKWTLEFLSQLVSLGIDVSAQNTNGFTAAQLLGKIPQNIKILPEMIRMLSDAAPLFD